jgi:hypothetical protein
MSWRGGTCDRTVWTEGMSMPWAIPTKTRAAEMAALLWADPGVSIEAVDHKKKDAASMSRPPSL